MHYKLEECHFKGVTELTPGRDTRQAGQAEPVQAIFKRWVCSSSLSLCYTLVNTYYSPVPFKLHGCATPKVMLDTIERIWPFDLRLHFFLCATVSKHALLELDHIKQQQQKYLDHDILPYSASVHHYKNISEQTVGM